MAISGGAALAENIGELFHALGIPILEGYDHTVNFNYAKAFLFNDNKKLGEKYGLQWAEGYHYMNEIPFDNNVYDPDSPIEQYIRKNAVPK